MANKNTYKLYINIGEGGSSETIAGGSASESANDSARKNLQKGAGLLTAYGMVQPFINATEQIIQNGVKTSTSNTELSTRIGLLMNVANFGVKTAVSVASGMSLGQALGIGSGAGAGIGLVLAVASTITNIAVKQAQITDQSNIENEQRNILIGRAGVQFNRSRSGE